MAFGLAWFGFWLGFAFVLAWLDLAWLVFVWQVLIGLGLASDFAWHFGWLGIRFGFWLGFVWFLTGLGLAWICFVLDLVWLEFWFGFGLAWLLQRLMFW